jgi:hypothetical protein
MSAVGASTSAQIFTVSENLAHTSAVVNDNEQQRFKVSRVKI